MHHVARLSPVSFGFCLCSPPCLSTAIDRLPLSRMRRSPAPLLFDESCVTDDLAQFEVAQSKDTINPSVCWLDGLAATQRAKADSRFGRANHFFNTVNLIRLAWPCSSIPSTIFRSSSGALVRMAEWRYQISCLEARSWGRFKRGNDSGGTIRVMLRAWPGMR